MNDQATGPVHSLTIRTRMAIPNIKMTNPIKKLVSKQRIRYTKDGFNLDLTCILLIFIFQNYFNVLLNVFFKNMDLYLLLIVNILFIIIYIIVIKEC